MSPLLSTYTFLFFTIFFFPTSHAEGYTTCAPFSCGNFTDISYPFWSNYQPNYCGHPKFKLGCQQQSLTIDIISQEFHVIDINPKSELLKIARMDLWGGDSPSCPKYNNVSLDVAFFNFTSNDDNCTMLFDCGHNFAGRLEPSLKFTCLTTGYVAHDGYLVLSTKVGNFTHLGCKNNITIPVMREAFQSSFTKHLFVGDVLAEGFEVEWSGVDEEKCYGCRESGGRCGYNASQNAFMCLCPLNQQPYAEICSKTPTLSQLPPPPPPPVSGKLNWKRKVIIGVVCAFYLFKHRKKIGSVMSCMQSQSLSSDPSSKDPERGSQLSEVRGVHVFSYSELEEATNYFDSSRELGEGGFGTVYFGKLQDGRCVAVKRLYENNFRRVEQFMNEVQILARLVHPNLVSLYECTSRHNRELLLVYEYVPNGTVADHLHGKQAKPGTLPWHIRMNIAVETASALKYLHVESIIHRDIKTDNILLDNHFRVKVADFGLSRLFPTDLSHVSTAPQGTPGYVDPEYHDCYQLTDKSDVYSFGVVLIELISSLPAVDITRNRHEINLANMATNRIQNQALHELVDPSLGFESDSKVKKMINAVAELAFQCLQSSKDMKPSTEEVLDTLEDIKSDGISQP